MKKYLVFIAFTFLISCKQLFIEKSYLYCHQIKYHYYEKITYHFNIININNYERIR
jgi:hypothetical protein